MSYPGANRPQHHGHYQGPPPGNRPPPGPPPGFNAGPPQGGYGGYQPSYGGHQNQGDFGNVQHNYQGQDQQYHPPPGFSQPQFAPPSAPPPMRYQQPDGPPPPGYGPPRYQGAGYEVHYQPQNSNFQYSNCSGRRKALMVGINYTGTDAALSGCQNDVQNVRKFLIERYNFKGEDMVILMDKGSDPQSQPTADNIRRACNWLTRDARPNDSLFFHYSGHGGSQADQDGDEDDGNDETIYPIDFKRSGQIVDDELHELLVRPLPAGCRLTAIFDSCHSGSVLDLPYIYSTKGVIKTPNLLADAGTGAMSAVTSYMRGDLGGVFSAVAGFGKKAMNNGTSDEVKAAKTSPADVVMWSGCKDSQTSADTQEAGKATGAMSYAFIAALTKYPQQSYVQLLNTIRDELENKYSQKPQLSTGHEMDTNLLFII